MIGVIGLIFGYSFFFDNDHPIKCVYKAKTGVDCVSCGLSRGFSQLVRGNVQEALTYNQQVVYIFAFFLVQLLMRIVLNTLSHLNYNINSQAVLIADISVSVILFLFCFWPFIMSVLYG